MEPWQILVGLLQGLVEWLPISSEGQAVLFLYNIGTVPADELITLVIWLHLGTALAVIARYPKDILEILSLQDRKMFRLLLIATICTAVTAIPLYIFIKSNLQVFHGEIVNILVGVLLLITAVILYLPTRTHEEVTTREPDNKEAVVTGLIQGVAVLPGLSRSGVTISALLMQKVDKEKALKFSFLMSVPAVLGILALEIVMGTPLPSSMGVIDLAIVEIIVFITGIVSMEFLLSIARKIQFWKLCVIIAAIAILFGLPVFL